MALPPGAYAIKSAKLEKYLLCKQDGTLQFAGENSTDADAKFHLEVDKDHSDLVNIKSNNGRYWKRGAETTYSIDPIATEPNRDQSSPSCTLFNIEGDKEYRILHVQLAKYIEPNSADHNRAYADKDTHDNNQIVIFEGR